MTMAKTFTNIWMAIGTLALAFAVARAHTGADVAKVEVRETRAEADRMPASEAPPPASEAAKQSKHENGSWSDYRFETSFAKGSPHVGANALEVQVSEDGRPVEKLTLSAFVSMIGMDMGVTEPKVKEVAPGHYEIRILFPTAGEWRVRLAPRGSETGSEKVFEFAIGH